MKLRLLCMVSSDPRTSPRPAEALRIVAGLGAWLPTEVALFLGGPATIIAQHPSELTLGEEDFRTSLPLLAQLTHPVYVPMDAAVRQAGTAFPCAGISERDLALLAANSRAVMRF